MKPRDANDILREQVRSNEVRAAPSRPASWSDRRLILSSAGFVQGFVPPDYVIFGLLQRRFLYSITGKTGARKTAILLLTAAHVAEGKKIVDRDVEKGRVVYLAGENADDHQQKLSHAPTRHCYFFPQAIERDSRIFGAAEFTTMLTPLRRTSRPRDFLEQDRFGLNHPTPIEATRPQRESCSTLRF